MHLNQWHFPIFVVKYIYSNQSRDCLQKRIDKMKLNIKELDNKKLQALRNRCKKAMSGFSCMGDMILIMEFDAKPREIYNAVTAELIARGSKIKA